jgi:hypothetical protein
MINGGGSHNKIYDNNSFPFPVSERLMCALFDAESA